MFWLLLGSLRHSRHKSKITQLETYFSLQQQQNLRRYDISAAWKVILFCTEFDFQYDYNIILYRLYNVRLLTVYMLCYDRWSFAVCYNSDCTSGCYCNPQFQITPGRNDKLYL